MAWRQWIDAAHEAERAWLQEGHDRRLSELLEVGQGLVNRFAETTQLMAPMLKSLANSRTDGGVKDFIALLVPIERAFRRGICDHDLLQVHNDRQSECGVGIPLVVMLDNIRSAFNVGSILRTAECLGVDEVVLCGYTSSPTETKTRKTALGVEVMVNWRSGGAIREEMVDYQKKGFQILAAEVCPEAISIYDHRPKQPSVLVMGNERFGLDPDILEMADLSVTIPLFGRKNSLNVAVAFGILGFELRRSWQNLNGPLVVP